MNKYTIIALFLGILIIFSAYVTDIKSIDLILQPRAILIVIGGTLCATFLNFPSNMIKDAFRYGLNIFKENESAIEITLNQILQLSQFSRKNGILALNNVIEEVQDPFLRRALSLGIDINNPQVFYDILISQIEYEEEIELIYSRIFEAMGGYAPTFGIVGAVIGLIQVMSDLNDLSILGTGISTAFVATLYGVTVANLIFLPIAGNLKVRLREKIMTKEMILQGVISILMDEHTSIIEEKLSSFVKYQNINKIRV